MFRDRKVDGGREEFGSSLHQGIVTSLNCRKIKIGSYEYTPKEKVYISAKGIKVVAPSLKNESRDVALQIQLKEIVRILVHFGYITPVVYLYTTNKCSGYIRKALDMTEDGEFCCIPLSKKDPQKRITLLPEHISEEAKIALKNLFGKVLNELSAEEANDISIRTCPRDSNNVPKLITRSAAAAARAKSENPAEIRQILIYPPGKGGIPINTEDYMCLAKDQFLNDVIIDFYLKHLVHDVLTSSQREKTHIFSTFFYKRLTTKPSKVNKSSNPHEWDISLTPAQERHARVKTWTKNVNIFDKDFIVVPINENCHWFVAIICYPSLDSCRSMIDNRIVTPQEIKKRGQCMQCDTDDEEADKAHVEKKVEPPQQPAVKTEPVKQPCILIFDSLAGASRSRVVATLRDYLTCEYQTKIATAKIFNKNNMKGSCPKVPQQNNFTDCGLYLLQYVEQFFKDPILDYSLPIKQLANWFDEIVVTRKREEISHLLKALMDRFNPDSHLTLPDIAFPTLNAPAEDTKKKAPLKNKSTTDYEGIDFLNTSKSSQGKEWNFKISSWNVDGLRPWLSKGGLQYIEHEKPDILCLQELKCSQAKFPDEIANLPDYHAYWLPANKDGYSGVGIYTTKLAMSVQYGLQDEELDAEGRIITAEYEHFYLVCTYVPNAGRKLVTLPKRLRWDEEFLKHVTELDKKKPVIICGDMNVAHNEIDLANATPKRRNAGFTDEERAGMTRLLGAGLVDTYRRLHPARAGAYTFWPYMRKSRAKNVGWRLDYFIASERLLPCVCDTVIRDKVYGSDHCPITLFLHLTTADKPKEVK